MEHSNSRTFQGPTLVFKDFQGVEFFSPKFKDFQGLLKDPMNPELSGLETLFVQNY